METPKYGHDPISMHKVEAHLSALNTLGDFYWEMQENKRLLWLAIPIGEFDPLSFALSNWTVNYENPQGTFWSWDGDEEKPTLEPSLHAIGIWHGWIKKGIMVEV